MVLEGLFAQVFFAKHTTEYRRISLLAMMQKMTILATESMLPDQKDTKAAKEVAKTMAAEAYSTTKKIKRLESKLVALKESNVFAPLLCRLIPLAKRSLT